MLLAEEVKGLQFGLLDAVGEGKGIEAERGETGGGEEGVGGIGGEVEEEDDEWRENGEQVPLLELELEIVEATWDSRPQIFDVEGGGGGRRRRRRGLPLVLLDEGVAVLFLVGRGIPLHFLLSHGGWRRPPETESVSECELSE